METYKFRQAWSVSVRRGRQKQEKKKEPEGEKVAPAKERFRVSSTEKFLFLVNEYLGSERPVSFE